MNPSSRRDETSELQITMSNLIAITGKGGTGKTTLSGLIIRALIEQGKKPVLAVDADPNTCLDATLGVKVEKSVGTVREEALKSANKSMAGGISKQQLLELKISECLVEGDDFDLISMGRCEGPGCYCYANNVLKDVIGRLSAAYPYLVLDNEAGLENLSRRIVQKVDLMVMVADPSKRGIETILRLHKLAGEMQLAYGKLAIIINRLRTNSLPESAAGLKQQTGADTIIGIADNEEIADMAEQGKSIWDIRETNSAARKIAQFLAGMNL